ncbi:MAG: hypothetical protein AAGB07_15670 [Pseudomonadota bacterium]
MELKAVHTGPRRRQARLMRGMVMLCGILMMGVLLSEPSITKEPGQNIDQAAMLLPEVPLEDDVTPVTEVAYASAMSTRIAARYPGIAVMDVSAPRAGRASGIPSIY